MTTRYSAVLVTFTDDIREDDAEPLIAAIRLLHGVQAVKPVQTDITARFVEDSRIRHMVASQLADLAERIITRADD